MKSIWMKITVGLIVIFILYVVWGKFREKQALANATSFCEKFPVGTAMAEVSKAASTVGDNLNRVIDQNKIMVGFIGLPPFSRYFCEVNGQGGKVVSFRITYMD